ncbi:MAG TPA: hypothetical protein VNQ99_15860 [Xanthobacteraceae bacterium]|nr:hypothetical protein [Xanthobacteraceae bacterium]
MLQYLGWSCFHSADRSEITPVSWLIRRGDVIARIECRSAQAGVASAWVDIDCITDAEVMQFHRELDNRIAGGGQVSNAVAAVFAELTEHCPNANPSDLWHHVIYRHLLSQGWSDNRWKRVSGFALERALQLVYQPRLTSLGIRMHIVSAAIANAYLSKLGIVGFQASKFDMFLEGLIEKEGGLFGTTKEWVVFGSAHVKSSIAERIQDDVPASLAFMERGLTSIAITMDAKSYPPPHGQGINYGELGGRSIGVEKDRIKRRYVENDGQFDAMFSYNLRTPESPATTPSGKRIMTLGMHEQQPDKLVAFLEAQWKAFAAANDLKAIRT